MDTREIRIDLSTAKKWYEKGGELKDLALTAYKEEELIGLPKTWKDYVARNDKGLIIDAMLNSVYGDIDYKLFNKEQSQAHIALMKLHLLRDEYRNGWSIETRNLNTAPHTIFNEDEWDSAIGRYKSVYKVKPSGLASRLLEFQDKETATEFLNNFRDLIEQAGDLV